jgi:hypothetical protein
MIQIFLHVKFTFMAKHILQTLLHNFLILLSNHGNKEVDQDDGDEQLVEKVH